MLGLILWGFGAGSKLVRNEIGQDIRLYQWGEIRGERIGYLIFLN